MTCETWIHCFTFDQLKILYGSWSQCVLIRLYITAQWNLKLELTFSYYIAVSVAAGDLPSNLVSYSPGQIVHGICKWPRLDSQIFELSSVWCAGCQGCLKVVIHENPTTSTPGTGRQTWDLKLMKCWENTFTNKSLTTHEKSKTWNASVLKTEKRLFSGFWGRCCWILDLLESIF